MKRNTLNFVIDVGSALVMAGMIATGLLIRFVLPPGSGGRRALWGWGRHDWGDLHFWLAVATGAVVALHVALHWQWVCVTALRCVPGRADGKPPPPPLRRNVAGAAFLGLLVASFATFVWVAGRNVTETRGGGGGEGHGREAREAERDAQHPAGRGPGEGRAIRGSMSLSEVAAECGVTVETARARLGLPPDVPADERLGRLSARHGFSIPEARERLAGVRSDR